MEEFDFSLDDFSHFTNQFGAIIEKDDFIEYIDRYGHHACFELQIKCKSDQVFSGNC